MVAIKPECEPNAAPMLVLSPEQTRASLSFPRLIPALRGAFVAGAQTPLRHRHDLPQPDTSAASLLLMPAWRPGGFLGVKLVTVFPNQSPAVSSSYLLADAQTGRHLALIDGTEITGRRTAAASALAASFLARADAANLLVVGAGHIASLLPEAYAAIRPIRDVTVWNHRPEGAQRLASTLQTSGFNATPAPDLAAAATQADIITCATLSRTPLIQGEWLRPGVHLDLIGGFTPAMREADDFAIRRATVFIDTEAALVEAGDLIQPLASSILSRQEIAGDLAMLCKGQIVGRRTEAEITLFKSVGSALEDLAAAALAYQDVASTSC